jgi:hypothetical protein
MKDAITDALHTGAVALGIVLLALPAFAQEGSRSPSACADQPQEQTQNEHQGTSNNRLFGALPDFLTVENADNVPPLTTRQKYNVTARSTFDVGQYLFAAGLAVISQAENADPSYGQGAAGYGKRFGLIFADLTVENFLTTAILPSAFHEDPRYFRLGSGSIWSRAGYSVSRIVVTRRDTGGAQFNFSEILGSAAAAGLYNTYHPGSDRTLPNTLASWWMQVGFDTGFIIIREFWPDVHRKFSHPKDAPAAHE